MGNSSIQTNPAETVEQIVDSLFSSTEEPTFKQINGHLISFLRLFQQQLPCKIRKIQHQGETKDELVVSEPMVRIFHHQFFREKIIALIKLLAKKLNYMITKKSMLIISRSEWQQASLLADFIVIFIDDRMRNLCDSLKYRNDIEENSKKYATNQNTIPVILQELDVVDKEEFADTLRDVLFYSFKMKGSLLSRSPRTQAHVDSLLPSLFLIYIKLYSDAREEFRLKFSTESQKENIFICANAIGLGLQYKKEILIDLANNFLQNVLKKSDWEAHSMPPIPSHFFEHLPIFHCKNIYESIVIFNLYALTQVKKDSTDEQAKYAYFYKINRIQALRLTQVLIKVYQPSCPQIIYFSNFLWNKIDTNKIQKYFVYRLGKAFRNIGTITPNLKKYLDTIERKVLLKENKVAKDGGSETDNKIVMKEERQIMGDEEQVVTQVDTLAVNPLPLIEALSEKFIYEKICKLPTKADQSQKYLRGMIKMEGSRVIMQEKQDDNQGENERFEEQDSQNVLSKREKNKKFELREEQVSNA